MIVDRLAVEERAAKRKRWRAMGLFQLPAQFSRRAFFELLGIGLVEAFRGQDPVSFNVLLDITKAKQVTVYQVTSPYIELTDTIHNRVRWMVTEMEDPSFNAEDVKLRHLEDVKAALGDFCVTGSFKSGGHLNCHECRYDPRSKTASITPVAPRSTRPQDYPGRLETTSELLEYLAALYSANSLMTDMGDPFWVRSYAWIKFITDFIDHRAVDLGRVQVNDVDPEEWDYINSDIDYQIETRQG